MAGVYIHIPFCRRKCYYCDFFSVGSRNAPWVGFAQALQAEARARAGEWQRMTAIGSEATPDTLYIGGGTPSQMPADLLVAAIKGIREALPGFDPQEMTVEVNPEDVTEELADALAGCGVNRVSMGVQTLCAEELVAIGRRHSPEQALRAYEVLRPRFADVSLDLMFGLPLQDMDSWRRSVEGVLALRPEHLSAYSLMWEERTALCKMRSLGKVEECDENLSDEMFRLLTSLVSAAGYEHYEISNYCLPGHRSRHNSAYWTGIPYLGLGPGAHSYDGERMRRANTADIQGYIGHYRDGKPDIEDIRSFETLSDEELREEYIMTRLRRMEGIELTDFGQRFGDRDLAEMVRKARLYPTLLHTDATRVRLTAESVMRSDSAIVALL